MIFGRRKIGKTFLVRNFLKWDRYYFVTRSMEVFSFKNSMIEQISYPVFFDRIKREMTEKLTIVIDEFQRLPEDFLDFLHAVKPIAKAKMMLISSSLYFVEKILGTKSPLLGIVTPFEVGLIKCRDVLSTLLKDFDAKTALVLATFIRDPFIMESVILTSNLEKFLTDTITVIKNVVPALIGEIFGEEGKKLTARYEAIMKAIAAGNHTPGEVASYISGQLGEPLKSQDVKKYMRNLSKMGICKRIKIYQKKKYFYQIESPLIDLHYYLDVKMGYTEMYIPLNVLLEEAKKRIPLYYQEFIVNLFAEILNARIEKRLKDEIDGIYLIDRKPIAIIEVKMGKISREDVKKIIEKARELNTRPIIFGDNRISEDNVISITPNDLPTILRNPNTLKKKLY